MPRNTKHRRLIIVLLAGVVGILLNVVTGCRTQNSSKKTTISSSATNQPSAAAIGKGGAQLWTENCMRCHNIRDPQSYSDAQWQVAMHHMRLRANLTAEEHETILKFLQASND